MTDPQSVTEINYFKLTISSHILKLVYIYSYLFCCFMSQYWSDDYLVWDPADYGNIEHTVVPASDVWLPDIGLVNG